MADTGCYNCIHLSVCKHFDGTAPRFPYKSDQEIGPLLHTLSESLSKACAYFIKREEHNKAVETTGAN